MKKPECEKWWTLLYYGSRGSCKSLHQAKLVLKIFKYLDWLYYKKHTYLKKHAIVYSVQLFNKVTEQKYSVYKIDRKLEWDNKKQFWKTNFAITNKINNPNGYLYYWKDAGDLQYCPRPDCWKGTEQHRLHNCYVIFDDMATIMPSDNWQNTPIWLRKMFSQARHFGIRVIANVQDPFSVDINFRRYTDMCYRFSNILKTRDYDETKPPIKHPFGLYMRRKIKAEYLWRNGDAPEEDIKAMKEQERIRNKVEGRPISDLWTSTYHYFTKKDIRIYDTTQDVPEYSPVGYMHSELYCIDPEHNHTDKNAPNYCGYKKVNHGLV